MSRDVDHEQQESKFESDSFQRVRFAMRLYDQTMSIRTNQRKNEWDCATLSHTVTLTHTVSVFFRSLRHVEQMMPNATRL